MFKCCIHLRFSVLFGPLNGCVCMLTCPVDQKFLFNHILCGKTLLQTHLVFFMLVLIEHVFRNPLTVVLRLQSLCFAVQFVHHL